MSLTSIVVGSSPSDGGGGRSKVQLAFLRALRTFIQGLAAAFPSAGAGTVVLSTGYWETFSYACIAALITAIVSFLQNVAAFLPADPTQT